MENRDYLFDNAKGMLIFAVVLGHILEYDLTGIARAVYIVIYSVHMPLFVLISGYFARFNAEKILKKLVAPYLAIQLVCTIFVSLFDVGGKSVQLTTPCWYLWYMPALAVWKISIPFIESAQGKKQRLILLGSVAVALVSGYDDTVGYYMSLSRIITFYPYFLFGYFAGKNKESNGKEYDFFSKLDRGKCKAVLISCVVLLFVISPRLDCRWLYGAYSYSQIGYGPVHRFAGYVFGAAMSICILKLMSREKSFVSEIGKKSMYIYLGHAPGVALFKKLCEKIYPIQNIAAKNSPLNMLWISGRARQLLWIMLAVAGSAVIVGAFCLDFSRINFCKKFVRTYA